MSRGGVSSAQNARFEVLLRRPENRVCFDCGANQPRWASTNLGIFFCLHCSGIHRSMGVHISKVKSTNMDVWDEAMMQLIEHIGNKRGRMLYEYQMPESVRPVNRDNHNAVDRFIRNKYERRMYYHPQFEQMLQQYLEQDLSESSGSPHGSPPTTVIAPRPAAPVEELWGPPVAAAPAPAQPNFSNANNSAGTPPAGSASYATSQMEVAELFSSPAHSAASPASPNPAWGAYAPPGHASAWGSAPPSHAQQPVRVVQQQPLQPPHPAQQQPPQPQQHHSHHHHSHHHHAHVASYPGVGAQPPRRHPDEAILSLFENAPPAGCTTANTGDHVYAAWQPMTVKPYYGP